VELSLGVADMTQPMLTMSVTVNQKDLDRIEKRLDKWQGKPLAMRMDKAERAGMNLYVAPLKAAAAAHNLTGATQRGMKVRALRKRRQQQEVAAYKAGSSTRHRHFAVVGTSRGVEADPYVDRIQTALEPRVVAFIEQQVMRLE
jgi:hypothetical protein